MKSLWDRIAGMYDLIMSVGHGFYSDMEKDIKNELHPNDVVLEAACGTGTITAAVSPYVKEVFACDISDAMIHETEKKIDALKLDNVTASVADAGNLPFPDHSFDVVIISAALHIIPEPENVLKELGRVLKNDGKLIAPVFLSGSHAISKVMAQMMRLSGYRDYHSWNGKTYIRFLNRNGWKVCKAKGYKGMMPMEYAVCRQKTVPCFPVFVSLADRKVLCVGAGKVASRRIKVLLPFGCRISVTAPEAKTDLICLSEEGKIRWNQREYKEEDLRGMDMVLALTDDPKLNARIADACRKKHIPVNVGSDKNCSDFYFPGIARRDGIVAGITASGADHTLARVASEQVRSIFEKLK